VVAFLLTNAIRGTNFFFSRHWISIKFELVYGFVGYRTVKKYQSCQTWVRSRVDPDVKRHCRNLPIDFCPPQIESKEQTFSTKEQNVELKTRGYWRSLIKLKNMSCIVLSYKIAYISFLFIIVIFYFEFRFDLVFKMFLVLYFNFFCLIVRTVLASIHLFLFSLLLCHLLHLP